MRKISLEDLIVLLNNHKKWLVNNGGERADLNSAILSFADLRSANLRSADLRSANLSSADLRSADLRSADLSFADLRSANLSSADLRSAILRSADLSSADLRSADLRSADLSSADLRSANLRSAEGVNKYIINPYYILLDQPGSIRAYKLIKANHEGPYNGGIRYNIGQSYEVLDANADEYTDCGAGINVATLDWCLREYQIGYKILIVEFQSKDIAAIPIASDGKIRLYRCKVISEIDLKKYGVDI